MEEVDGTRHEQETALLEKQLQQYVLTSLQQNFSPDEISRTLLDKGYDEDIVFRTLSLVNQQYYHGELPLHKPHSSHLLLILVFVLLIGIVTSYFLFDHEAYSSNIAIVSSDLEQGDSLSFFIQTNRDIVFDYELTTSQGNLVERKKETITESQTYSIFLPFNLEEGTYNAQTKLVHDQQEQLNQFSFTIRSSENDDSLPSQTIPVEEVITQDPLEDFSAAIQSLESSSCQALQDNTLRDECYFVISRDLQDGLICSSIRDDRTREDCYLMHILSGKSGYCERLESNQNIAICDSLTS